MTAGGEHPVADGLIRLSVLTQSAFARVAERHGLPAAQARLLCVLAGGARGMSELAGLLGIEKAALTGLADRAERRGLIARTAVPGDRRALSVALTPGGRDAASAFHRELSAELAGSPTCCHRPNAPGSAAAWPGSPRTRPGPSGSPRVLRTLPLDRDASSHRARAAASTAMGARRMTSYGRASAGVPLGAPLRGP